MVAKIMQIGWTKALFRDKFLSISNIKFVLSMGISFMFSHPISVEQFSNLGTGLSITGYCGDSCCFVMQCYIGENRKSKFVLIVIDDRNAMVAAIIPLNVMIDVIARSLRRDDQLQK